MKRHECAICQKAKGKRLCKIKEKSFICTKCCAENRGNSCSGCSYYAQAEKYALEKIKKSDFKHFTAMIDPEVDEKVNNALAYVEKGNIHEGERLLTQQIKQHPNLHIVQYGMGTVLAMKGDYSESIKHFNKALEIFPYFVEAWFNKGNSQKNLFDVGGAIYSFQKVIQFGDPKDSFVKSANQIVQEMETIIYSDTGLSLDFYIQSMNDFNSAFSKMQKRDYDKAIAGFQKVASINTKNAQTFGNLGLCYAFQGQKEKALEAFEQSLLIDPKYQPAIENKRILLSLKDGEKLPDNCVRSIEYYKEIAEKIL